jgi:23S rRNA (uracil1939-C5)-methyltransferase
MAAADALRRFMAEDNITAWDPKWGKGLIRHLVVKTGFVTGQVMVIIVINGKGIPNAEKLIEMLDDAIYEVGYSLESVVLNIKKGKPNDGKKVVSDNGSIMGDENIVIAGSPVIKDEIGGLEFEISPMSFYQVNPVQVERLYGKVREYCGLDSGAPGECKVTNGSTEIGAGARKPVILDLYCGVGTIGLSCARDAEFVVGIESVKEAVLDANRNAVVNGIVNARFLCGKAEEVIPQYINFTGEKDKDEHGVDPELARYVREADIAILDPPRAGCRPELLESVASARVPRIVYVSCDPATLARDVKLLGSMGYGLKEATPVDMFPWTSHVETVCLMSRKDK